MKKAFLFAGQGAQYVGMGKDLCHQYVEVNETFESASEALDKDIKRLCFDGPDEELRKTENTQPAILTMDVAIAKILFNKEIKPDVMAGLSLGEYAALVTSGALEFTDAVKLVRKRGLFMQEAVPLGVGAMAAIIGLERESVNEIIIEASKEGIIECANYNYPGQIVVSGEKAAVQRAGIITSEKGGRSVMLPVSAPFHCSMLKGAGEKLSDELDKINTYPIKVPVISNVTANFYTNENIKELLVKQVSHSVFWEDAIMKMINEGVEVFIEIGPGKALTGFTRKITKKMNKDVFCYNVEDINSLEGLLNKI